MEKLKFYGLLLVVLLISFSCSDTSTNAGNTEDPDNTEEPDLTDGETTVDEDIEHIELSLDNTIAALQELGDGEFLETMQIFLGANAGDFSSEDWAEQVANGLENVIDADATEDNGRFNFSAHTGVYEWSSSFEGWEQTSSSTSIILKFPSSENSSSNDMTFTLSEYGDVSTNIDGEAIYLPSRIQSKLERDGNVIFKFNLNNIEYSSNDLSLPVALDLEILSAPVTHTLVLNRSSETNLSFSWNINKGEELVAGTSLGLTLTHSDFSTLDEEDLEELSGSFELTEDLSINFTAELGTLLSIDDSSENQVNSIIKAEVTYQDQKIADLEYSESEENIIIIYKDGSSETVDRYYEGFAEDLEIIFYAFTGDWVEL